MNETRTTPRHRRLPILFWDGWADGHPVLFYPPGALPNDVRDCGFLVHDADIRPGDEVILNLADDNDGYIVRATRVEACDDGGFKVWTDFNERAFIHVELVAGVVS